MTKSIKKNMPMAEKLFPAMQQAGVDIINGTATSVSVAKHIEEILALGYKGKIHERFSDFVIQNTDFLDPHWRMEFSAGPHLIKPVGEILVDWIVLEAARKLTTGERIVIGIHYGDARDEFLRKLPFIPPDFNIPAHPYTPVAHTFWGLGHHMGRVEHLADSKKYDDIFDKILLWKTSDKEPFHLSRFNGIRSVEDYHQQRVTEILREVQEAKEEAKRNVVRVWADNTNESIQNKDQRKKDITRMENMGLVERLEEIANSEYLIDYYVGPPHRGKWGEQFAEDRTVDKISENSKKRLIMKLHKKNYHKWENVKSQLAQESFSDNE